MMNEPDIYYEVANLMDNYCGAELYDKIVELAWWVECHMSEI